MSMFAESLRAFLKPVVPLLDDPDVSEILINGPREVWIEKKGRLSRTDIVFSEEGLLAAARNMAQYVGRPLTEERPRLDARLPDGSRIHVVLGPVARKGTTISIRKFFAERLSMEKLVEFGSVTPELVQLLRAAIELRLNIVVAGGTGSGKTSLLNALSSMIAPHERILTIEDSAELQLAQPHLVSLESRPADKLGKGEINIGDLLHSALRLRPDRIIVGEVRGGECFYLLQAMNTGHGGTLTTAHANTPIDTLRRLEMLCLLSGIEMPLRAVRAQVASAVHLLICCERLSDGKRKITSVAEALPLDDSGDYRTQELFVFEQDERGPNGEVLGHHVPTGLLPTFFPKLRANGLDLPASFFDPAAQGLAPPRIFAADLGARSVWAKDHGAAKPAAHAPAALPTAPSAAPVLAHDLSIAGHAAPIPAASATSAPPIEAPKAPAIDVPIAAAPVAESPPAQAQPARADDSSEPIAAAAQAGRAARVEQLEPAPSSVAPALAASEGSLAAEAEPTRTEATDPGSPSLHAPTAAVPAPPARTPAFAPASAGKPRAPGAVRTTQVLTPSPPEKKRSPAPSLAPSAPPSTQRSPAPSTIELDPELAAEVAAAMPYESTLITRNPLLDKERPPLAKTDDDTNPGARRPPRR